MTVENFKRIVRLGSVNIGRTYPVPLFCTIEYDDGRLSISGVEGPKDNGDCFGSSGQIVFHQWDFAEYDDGFDAETVKRFREIWEQWHLNDMQAGSPDQTKYLDSLGNDFRGKGFDSHYSWACEVLADAGLQPDPNFLHNDKPYSYGSAWLRTEVPNDVLEWLQSLPEAHVTRGKCWFR